jgi:sulfite reductase (NADPH) hemoprotein beta-component
MSGLSRNEGIKARSQGLRGTITDGLARTVTGALAEDDTQLIKFHGFYQQDDRDLRAERRKKLMEPAYSFMIRVRIPGGLMTSAQWLAFDRLADDYANGTLRLTTRQAIQFHGIIKSNLKTSLQGINATLLDTMAACGDVNRNVMAAAHPGLGPLHAAAAALAAALSAHLLPRSRAYHEIWLDGEPVTAAMEEEPIYGRTYLPRKFKTVVAVPPVNDVDVYAQDLAFVAIADRGGTLAGWNVTVGGGMGMTHGEPDTFPRLADELGFCRPEDAVRIAEAVVTVQRDWGDRASRKHARLKYTIERKGLDAFRAEVERRAGITLAPPHPTTFTRTGDALGWIKGADGRWSFGLWIENGRVRDLPGRALKTGLRAIAAAHDGGFVLTGNQNLVIANVPAHRKAAIGKLLDAHGLIGPELTGLRRNAMACVSLPTCGLALAESERYLPDLVTDLEAALAAAGLGEDEITIRMTGCPNGCARPFLAEIGLVGRAPGRYHLYLGAAFDGTRLNKLHKADVDHAAIVAELAALFRSYADGRRAGERFGDFVVRTGIVAPTSAGRHFHEDVKAA